MTWLNKVLSDLFFLFLHFFLWLNMNDSLHNGMVSDLIYHNIQVFPAAMAAPCTRK